MTKFEGCIDYVLKNEGGYVNHPNDSGGPTNMGVTLATLSRWRAVQRGPSMGGQQVCTEADIKELSTEEARKIYYEYYWMPLHLDGVKSSAICTAMLDTAVLRGTTKAIMYAQKTCNAFIGKSSVMKGLEVDGRWSADLTGRINNCDAKLWVAQFADFLAKAYIQITLDKPEKKCFLAGWLNRNDKLLDLTNE